MFDLKTANEQGSEWREIWRNGAQDAVEDRLRALKSLGDAADQQMKLLQTTASAHAAAIAEAHRARAHALFERSMRLAQTFESVDGLSPPLPIPGKPEAAEAVGSIWSAWRDYLRDVSERWVLTLDALRERGDVFIAHEAAGAPPVLAYDYEVALDGRSLPRPCNYLLLKIRVPASLAGEGVETLAWKRPYVIIDPRAGHGAGIGGFKMDSQVGVALRDGHPVYFVAFRQKPEPGQTLADVTKAEAAFVREVIRRHPDAPKPVVVGNCQGGWGAMLLAATHPDLAGPVVANGAPLAYWSGKVGENPMRYNGGMLGGALPAKLTADLAGGLFDGANLVMNFEALNPGRTYFRKYYDLFADPVRSRRRFIEFERWWGGFYFMNAAEIEWIVEELFVGNKLGRNHARLETGRVLDLKKIRSPIIVFASHGDNITPPQQALNWIIDSYADEDEIKICGQRILYMVHEEVGHLGIFVSSSIAKKEHAEMASTLKTIEALAPGLYEMKIEAKEGEGVEARFRVSFHARTLKDLAAYDDGREEEAAFAAVARLSQNACEAYEIFARPLVQAAVPPAARAIAPKLHPMRLQRAAVSSQNPLFGWTAAAAERARETRVEPAADNPFLALEQLTADMIEQSLDLFRDLRGFWYEWSFYALYASPPMLWFGAKANRQRTRKDAEELRQMAEVQAALLGVDRGGFVEGVIRMLVLLAGARGAVRRDRLERSGRVLTKDAPFRDLDPATRARVIHEQTLIARFEPDQAIDALPSMLRDDERDKAVSVVEYIAGDVEDMEPHTLHMLNRIRVALDLPRLDAGAATIDPLAEEGEEAESADGSSREIAG